MATINAILEGKTGNYFKLEDFGDDWATITESIDPEKTDIRTEKVKNKEVKADGKTETEYYHIGTKCGDVEKDLSLTFTALKQLAQHLPRKENWRGYQFKYTGTKGTGKNIKYGFMIGAKVTVEQSRLDAIPAANAPVDNAYKLLSWLRMTHAQPDEAFWKNATSSGDGCPGIPIGTLAEVVALLKKEGRLVFENGSWRAT